ncbi:unnamed protein product [Mytilus edulis]|uniref:Integrase catalytic domain-containing protein n=1 Tax=Mytilus edulis TaxID=6550 RepID=A0A8S3SH71_MYTED|nr:unnamed protein product [Mytilus edulis]
MGCVGATTMQENKRLTIALGTSWVQENIIKDIKFRERFTWYNQRKDVEQWCKCCNICAPRKPPSKKPKAPLQQYNVGAPFERIGIDILGPLPKSTRGNKFLLVIGDYFTKWMEAIPIQDREATTVANKLIERIVTIFGVPMEIHSDRGSNFESNVFAETCKILGINKTRSTPLRPQVMGWLKEGTELLKTCFLLLCPKIIKIGTIIYHY